MKGFEMKEDTVAIKDIAIFYGIPKYGHATCLRKLKTELKFRVRDRSEEVTIESTGIRQLHCVACGNLLIPEQVE